MAKRKVKSELEVLQGAVSKALKAVESKGTKGNIDNLKAAKDALKELEAEISGSTVDTLPNLRAVAAWLEQQGWKVSESTVYKHREEGKISPDDKGVFPLKRVNEYAVKHLERIDGSEKLSGADEKSRAEARRIEASAKLMEIKEKKLRGSVLDREQVELENAAKAAMLVADCRSWCHAASTDIIKVVDGDITKTTDLTEHLISELDLFFDKYSNPREYAVDLTEVKN